MKTRIFALALLLPAALALPCAVERLSGVHFKNPSIDFGQPPARLRTYPGTGEVDAGWRPGTRYLYDYDDRFDPSSDERTRPDPEGQAARAAMRLIRSARNAEARGRLGLARRIYASLGRAGAFVAARQELLATPAIEEHGLAGVRGLATYLRATHPFSGGRVLLPTEVAPVLRPWLAYARAGSPADYLALASACPDSSRAPAALVMAGRLLTQRKGPSLVDLQTANLAFHRLIARYPRSRFVWDAQGGLGRIDYLRGRFDVAVRRYEGQAQKAATFDERTRALNSIAVCAVGNRSARAYTFLRLFDANLEKGNPFPYEGLMKLTLEHFTGADARTFWTRLHNDPPRLATYVEWRATNGGVTTDLQGLAAPALRLAPGTRTQGRIAAALARVTLRNGQTARTTAFARLAARVGGPDERALAAYVLATLDRRAGRFAAARRGYQRLLATASKSYLAGGARENLAVVSERLGDWGAAMDQYRALGYQGDIAYLADVRMTPPQLAAYVRKHPQVDGLRYTLAMRHLRRGEWNAAERVLRDFSARRRRWLTSAIPYNGEEGGLQDPLATVRALRRLDRAVRRASNREAKAAALVRMGDYYYNHRYLLLYSGPVWQGMRDTSVAFSWNPAVATADDDRALHVHFDEHECYAQAFARYRRVVREFPHTRVAPTAAYRAAVAEERLSNMAVYWRWRENRDDRQGDAVRLLGLAAKSPNPTLSAKARKYAKVFADERAETRRAFAEDKAPARRWDPYAN